MAHRFALVLAFTLGLVCLTPTADAAQHLIDVNEVFSNADGTVQFVELIANQSFQSVLAPTSVRSFNADGTVETIVFDFTASYPPFGAGSIGLTILLATEGFEAEFGFAPDFIIPDNSISLVDGRVIFSDDVGGCATVAQCGPSAPNCAIDGVAYGAYTGGNTGYGDPAPALPTDGCMSLTRVSSSNCNHQAFEIALASPRRTDGTEGMGVCGPPPADGDFIRGDCNGDGMFNALVDILFLLDFGFLGGPEPACLESADVDGDGSQNALVDGLYGLEHGFLGGPQPPAPFPDCGIDPDVGGSLGCPDMSTACP